MLIFFILLTLCKKKWFFFFFAIESWELGGRLIFGVDLYAAISLYLLAEMCSHKKVTLLHPCWVMMSFRQAQGPYFLVVFQIVTVTKRRIQHVECRSAPLLFV